MKGGLRLVLRVIRVEEGAGRGAGLEMALGGSGVCKRSL